MNKKSKKSLLLACAMVGALTSCYKVYGLSFSLIAPLGAPSLVYISYSNDSKVNISSSPVVVKQAFFATSNAYDIIIFDLFSGLKMIHDGAPYRLARVVTLGNLFLVATGNDDDEFIDDTDNIAGFGENLMPDKIFKMMHSNLAVDYYLPSAAAASASLCAGMTEGKTLDYVVLSEPFIHNTLQNNNCQTFKKAKVIEDINKTFSDYTAEQFERLRGFPQAGLFISKKLEDDESKTKLVKNYFKTIDEDLRDLERNGGRSVGTLLLQYGTTSMQEQRFGITASTLSALQFKDKQSINKLAFNSFPIDLSNFAAHYASALQLVEPIPSDYSRYYLEVKEE